MTDLKTAIEAMRPDTPKENNLHVMRAYDSGFEDARIAAAALVSAQAGEAGASEPVAWMVFADNGNIRVWTASAADVTKLRERWGDKLLPLYTRPAPASTVPDVEALRVALVNLVEVAERCDSWQSFPEEPLEVARAALAALGEGE